MLSWVYLVLAVLSVAGAVIGGGWNELSAGAMDGAAEAVTLSISMAGSMGLWCGLSEVFSEAGASRWLGRVCSPLLDRLIGPKEKNEVLTGALSENFASNLLGLGNAATPAGLRAAGILDEAGDHRALLRLTLLNALSVQLIPFTAAALRSGFGAAEPFAILPRVLLGSAVALTVSFAVYRVLE